MTVAIRTALWDQVDSLGSLFGIVEFLYITLLVWLGTAGAGPLSIDHLIQRYQGHKVPAPILAGHTSTVTV
jgi:putative oxidoreductase